MTYSAEAHYNATRIFQFLQQYTALKYKPQRTHDRDTVLWLADLPDEKEIAHVLQLSASELENTENPPALWLSVKKPKLTPPPTLPDSLTPWVAGHTDDPSKPPRFSPPAAPVTTQAQTGEEAWEGSDTTGADAERARKQRGELETQWQTYWAAWSAWAPEAQRAGRVQQLYLTLLNMHQQLEAEGEKFELRLGIGLLTWQTPTGTQIRRHLLTARASLDFDVQRGIISVGPSENGASTTLEQDMLDPGERPHHSVTRELEDQLSAAGEDLWSGETLPPLLRTWVNAMDKHAGAAGSKYEGALEPHRKITPQLTVTFAPALILRKRVERSLNEAYSNIVATLEGQTDVPATLAPFLGEAQPPKPASTDSLASEIYFPLPANDGQRDIVKRLRAQRGVLVQGPPGTGKSHTIVNLVSHLLATDQRVLVASHAPRALKVLRDKFPAELSALCITHLRGEEGVSAILEQSVREILERTYHRNEEAEKRQIQQLQLQLEQARQQETHLLNVLRDIREGEVSTLSRFHYSGTAQRVAEQLRAEEERYGWLSDVLDAEAPPPETPPVTGEQAQAVLSHIRQLGEPDYAQRAAHLRQTFPTLAQLPRSEALLEVCKAEQRAEAKAEKWSEGRQYPHYSALSRLTTQQRLQVSEALESLHTTVINAQQHPSAWFGKAAGDFMRGEVSTWREIRVRTTELLPELQKQAEWLESISVSGLGGRDLQTVAADATAVRAHLAGGGKWKSFLGIGHPAAVKERLYLQGEVRVRGQAADTPQALDNLLRYLRLSEQMTRLEAAWKSAGVTPDGPVGLRIRFLAEQQTLLDKLDELTTKKREVQNSLAELQLPEPKWWESADVQAYAGACHAAEAVASVEQRRAEALALTEPLEKLLAAGGTHAIVNDLLEAMRARDPEQYGEQYRLLGELHKQREALQQVERWQQALAKAAPELVEQWQAGATDEHWEQLRDLEQAWAWWHTDQQLAEQMDPDTETNYRLQLREVRAEIRSTLGQLAAAKAWHSTLERITPREMQGLEGWRQATKRLGKGTGKHAGRHRRAARESLEQARGALPAWIMPLHLVAETFGMQPEIFDVVIVDEASQAGPEALFLSFLAKKIVIVGDDKQIEPDNVGIASDAVDALVNDFLSGLPLNARLALADRKASLFSFGAFSYSPAISLREHFRCMPEIIKFSSDLSYADHPLIALRQYGSDRLPPLVPRYIKDGYRDGKVNPPEAEAIVQQIKACVADPQYAGKTFGVISLIGDEQAEKIATLLRKELTDEEWQQRQIVCGNAYSFQGDERDVIFLSMVESASDSRKILRLVSSQSGTFQPRYNVAVSRARDQLWLFHSVGRENFNSKGDDLRARLIDHMYATLQSTSEQDEAQHLQLREEARRPLRGQRKPTKPFDSWFEVDVYLRLVERGYEVMPQYEMAGYRIDMVVVGARGRLAVECDGDHWHGPEKYSQDMHRQQILERAGMQFWRVRGSTFARDPELALEDLWATLDARGVYPKGDPRNAPETLPPMPAPMREPEPEQPTEDGPPEVAEGVKLDTEPTESAANETSAASSPPSAFQTPYQHWPERPLPDPRQCPAEDTLRGLLDIIEAEGPMLCRFAYQRYAQAAGLNYNKGLQSVLNRVTAAALRTGAVESRNEWQAAGQLQLVVRTAETPSIRVRTLGPRDFIQVPPSEIAALMQQVMAAQPALQGDTEQLFRHCLSIYGGQRLTMKRREVLERACQMLEDGEVELH